MEILESGASKCVRLDPPGQLLLSIIVINFVIIGTIFFFFKSRLSKAYTDRSIDKAYAREL